MLHSFSRSHSLRTLALASSVPVGAFVNPALNLAPYSRWTLREKAALRRLTRRYA